MLNINHKLLQLLLLFFVYTSTKGQDTLAEIGNSWFKLKTQLTRRAEVLSNLTSELSKSNKIDKQILNEAKSISSEFSHYIDTIHLDSNSIAIAQQKNTLLKKGIIKILLQIENNLKPQTNSIYVDLQAQLEGCENRIFVAKRHYNETCMKYNKRDLLFEPKTN